MRRYLLLVVAFVPLGACSNPLAPDASDPVPLASDNVRVRGETVTQNDFLPLDLFVFVPCAASGAGEAVLLQGSLHVLSHMTTDSTGGVHLVQHFNPQGVSGTGVTTGDAYHGTGMTRFNTKLTVGVAETYVNNFRIIGRGPGNNYLVHDTYRITLDAEGRLLTERFRFTVECK